MFSKPNRYYYINWDGQVYSAIDMNGNRTQANREINNYFSSEQKAIEARDLLLHILKLHKLHSVEKIKQHLELLV